MLIMFSFGHLSGFFGDVSYFSVPRVWYLFNSLAQNLERNLGDRISYSFAFAKPPQDSKRVHVQQETATWAPVDL
jgi:hypothetical protein